MEKFFTGLTQANTVEFRPELLSISAFAALWDRDTTKDKKEAVKQLSYVYFICSKSGENIYSDIDDKEERIAEAKKDIWGKKPKYDVEADELVFAAVAKYMERNPKNAFDIQVEFLTKSVTEEREYLTNLDKEQVTVTGVLLMKPADRLKAYDAISKTVAEIATMKNLAEELRQRENSIRGGGEAGLFDNDAITNEL